MNTIRCYFCHHVWELTHPLERGSSCPSCSQDSKICYNCSHYDPSAHHECRENQADWVRDKDKANFCGYFSPCTNNPHEKKDSQDDLQKLNALFNDDLTHDNKSDSNTMDKLESLFTRK